MRYEPLDRAIDKATRRTSIYPDAKHFGSIREQYVEKYGEKNWTAQLTKDLFGTSKSDKLAYPKGSEKYQAAELKYKANLRLVQRYGKGTINPARGEEKIQKKLAKIGKTLNPVNRIPPKRGLTITISGKQGSGRHERTRDFSTHMDYQFASQFIQDPTLEDFFHEVYPDWDDAVDVLFGNESGALGSVTVSA